VSVRRAVAFVVATVAVTIGTPLASARFLALPSGTVTVEATGPGGAVYTFDDPGNICVPPSGSTFSLGDTTVTCGLDSFVVHVVDTTPPVVTPPADVTVTTGDPGGTTASYGAASATDAVAGSPPVTCLPASGSSFGVGTTVVTCSASDGVNTGTANFNVTVNLVDSTPPTLSVPGSISAEATGPAGAAVAFSVTATDLVDPSPTVNCDHSSGSTFPLGSTTVTCTAKDASNNVSAPQSFDVTVADHTAPAFTTIPSGTITVEAANSSGASYSFTVAASDAVTASPMIVCNHSPSGETYPLGTTAVSCTATDSAGNAHTEGFSVAVKDTQPPTITTIPTGTIVREATGAGGASYSFTVGATDSVDPSPTVTCNHGPGAETYPVGTTHVSCTAKDASNNTSAPAGFDVSVADTTAPKITVPTVAPQEATGPGGAAVTFSVTATDAIDPSPAVACDHGSGSTFPLGVTTVTCTATDASHNASTGSFTVTVRDTKPPLIANQPDVTAEATGPGGAAVSYPAVTASDLVDGTVAATCVPASGSTFPLGNTTVTCNAADRQGNRASPETFVVKVQDTTGPAFTGVQSRITVEANGPDGAKVSFPVIGAVDLVDGPVAFVSCSPASGTKFALGTTPVSCQATDAHGNTGTVVFQVTVADTTPPTLAIPGPTTIYATTPTGIPETEQALLSFRHAATATDIVDPHPSISDNVKKFVEVGIHQVDFIARDFSGNATAKQTTLTVLPQPPAGTPALPLTPAAKLPDDVAGLQIFPGNGLVRLVWRAVPGAARYAVYRSQAGSRRLAADSHGQLVYNGAATTYTDRGLKNGVEYRYVVVSQDAAGNESAGVAVAGMPHVNLLRSPKDGARVTKPPKLVWTRNAEANYYNVQLYRGQLKILSTWPVGAAVQLKRTWKYQGRRYTLTKGVYRWYVWPGFGARSAIDYGELMGSSSFQIIR
jgi:hypothetical protein